MKPTLVILAGGLASRYGGIKQMETIGPSGEAILDYSVFDAARSGFGKVIFVINQTIENDFKEKYTHRFKGKIAIDFVLQTLDDLPKGFTPPKEREKPWGTGHAVRAVRNLVHEPFLVINADDFYGLDAFQTIGKYLLSNPQHYAMYAYQLGNTLSQHGTVSRGLCFAENGFLTRIEENTSIRRIGQSIVSDQNTQLDPNTPVSMNFWALKPDVFPVIEQLFTNFMKSSGDSLSAEFYIPTVIQHVIDNNLQKIKILTGNAIWFGMTYQSDRKITKIAINQLINQEIYPSDLWNH